MISIKEIKILSCLLRYQQLTVNIVYGCPGQVIKGREMDTESLLSCSIS